MRALDRVVVAQLRLAGRACEVEIAGFDEADVGTLSPSTCSRSPMSRRNSMPNCDIRMLTGLENCCRIELADRADDAFA